MVTPQIIVALAPIEDPSHKIVLIYLSLLFTELLGLIILVKTTEGPIKHYPPQ